MSSCNLRKCLLGYHSLKKCVTPLVTSSRSVRCGRVSYYQQETLLQQVRERRNKDEMEVLQGNTKAAKSYLERVKAHEKFMSEKMGEFTIGRRHLANMMGEDPSTFTQEDINRAVEYLFPSGLYEKKARPQMLPPDKVFPSRKEAQYDSTGRPYHTLFYTGQPFYYQAMHNIAKHMIELDKHEDKMILERRGDVDIIDKMSLGGSVWIKKSKLESMLLETIKDNQYDKFIMSMDRLSQHPYGNRCQEFIMMYREHLEVKTSSTVIPMLKTNEQGRAYMTAVGTRKSSKCVVKVIGDGSGYFNINGSPINYFRDAQFREQVVMPLLMCGLAGKVDVVCHVERGGESGQAGAIRFAIATALCSFASEDTIEQMRIAGLLTLDRRRRERKKPGQKGARAKFTWRKR